MTVRELINISPFFDIRVNGDDYDPSVEHYADEWIVEYQNVEVYGSYFISSCDSGDDKIDRPIIYLYISAEENE